MANVPFGTETSTSSMVSVTRSSRFSRSTPALVPLWVTVTCRPPHIRLRAPPAHLEPRRAGSRRMSGAQSRTGLCLRQPSCACSYGLADEDRGALVREKLPRRCMHGGLEFITEVSDRGRDGRCRSVTQCTEGAAEDVLAEVEQLFDVALLTLARLHPLQDLYQPPGALPARSALPARLVFVELGPAQHRPHHRRGFVEALQRLGAEHRFHGRDALVVQGDVEMLGGEHRWRGAPGSPELELVSVAHATGQVEQLAQGDAERRLELARVGHVAGQRIDGHALRLLSAHRCEPVRATIDDARDGRN